MNASARNSRVADLGSGAVELRFQRWGSEVMSTSLFVEKYVGKFVEILRECETDVPLTKPQWPTSNHLERMYLSRCAIRHVPDLDFRMIVMRCQKIVSARTIHGILRAAIRNIELTQCPSQFFYLPAYELDNVFIVS
jgi:hypothetical protein